MDESEEILPFLVVRGAGHAPVNGRYAHDGFNGGKAKFKQVDGDSIIFFDVRWKMTDVDGTSGWIYEGRQDNSPLPPSEWDNVAPRYSNGAAPSLSLGTCRDVEVGDEVTTVQGSHDVDWSGRPQAAGSISRLGFGSGSTWKVGRLQGDWFFPTQFATLYAPLSVLGYVSFNGKKHRIAELSASSSPQQAVEEDEEVAVEAEIVGGYDEEWCDDQDVEKFRCPICLLVARDAMAHDCGSVLFCEVCWVKCLAEDSKCPVCRNDGASIVPAHFERRSIRNLLLKCSCGERLHVHDKAMVGWAENGRVSL